MNIKSIIIIGLVLFTFSCSKTNLKNHIKSVTAITEVYGDGYKISAIALECDKNVANKKLNTDLFEVRNRKITRVYANDTIAKRIDKGIDGKYVIVELSTDFENPVIIPDPHKGHRRKAGEKPPHHKNEQKEDTNFAEFFRTTQRGNTSVHPGISLPSNAGGSGLCTSIKQTGVITTTDGQEYSPTGEYIDNTRNINLILDDFYKPDYTKNNQTMKYSIYFPFDYNPQKQYPMVVFLQDSGSCRMAHDDALKQGLGAVIWAAKEEQKKHECIVLVPTFRGEIINDQYECTDDVERTAELIKEIINNFSVDKNRVYCTGQAMGAKAALALNVKYPELFAASLLVAGSWDPSDIKPLTKQHLWFVTAEGDSVTYPQVQKDMETFKKLGVKTCELTWDGTKSYEELGEEAQQLMNQDCHLIFSFFKANTLVPKVYKDNSYNNQVYTWRKTYNIEALRNWLFHNDKR